MGTFAIDSMLPRLLSAVIGAPLALAVIWLGDPWFTAALLLVAFLALREFYGLASSLSRPLASFGTLWGVLLVAQASRGGAYTGPLITAAVIVSLILLLARRPGGTALADWGWTMAGIFYIGWMLALFPPLRAGPFGMAWSLLALLGAFATDTSAFLVGRAWGRHALAPAVSPRKTWEGALGGLIGAGVAVFVLARLFRLPLSGGQVFSLGVLVGIFAQVGDLAESLLKRRAGVKDAGRLIPGHGGILDRLDSLLFVLAVVYYYSQWAR